MKIQPYLDKLSASSEFKDFSKKNKGAFMMAGFFVLDFESGKNLHQIDYYIPSKKEVAAFTLGDKIALQLMKSVGNKAPEKLDSKINTDLDELSGILEDEMKNRSITENIAKIIAVIQNIEGKKIWVLNCVLSGMGILKAHIEDSSKSVLKMEKLSMTDIIKKIPPSALQQLQQAKQGLTPEGQPKKPSKEDAEAEIKKLDALEKAIEKEKEAIRQKAIESEKKSSVKTKAKKK